MDKNSLLEYVARVKNAEENIYILERVYSDYEKNANMYGPKEPEPVESVKRPISPIKKRATSNNSNSKSTKSDLSIAIGIGIIVVGIVLISDSTIWFGVAVLIIGAICLIRSVQLKSYENWKRNDEMNKLNEQYQKEYKHELEIYNKKVEAMDAEHEERVKKYEIEKKQYEEEHNAFAKTCNEVEAKIAETLTHVHQTLDSLYQQNIIFSKYRNLVAISSIYEYLASGRCDSLEGASGAYNIYEMELRQNIVIGQLSSIAGNLDQIKNNQYTLYSDLTVSNQKIQQLTSRPLDVCAYTEYCDSQLAKDLDDIKWLTGFAACK